MRRLALLGILLLLSALMAAAQPADQPAATGEPAERILTPEEALPAAPSPAPSLPMPGGLPVQRGVSPGAQARPMPGALGPARTIMLDVRGLDIDHLLKLLGEAAGLTIVKDPTIAGPVTIIAPKPVSIEEALEILNSVLGIRGFTAVRQGQVLKIVALDKAMSMTTETHVGADPSSILPGDRIITQIVPLANLDCNQVVSQLSPLAMAPESIMAGATTNSLYITDTASNVQRLLGIINEMEKRSSAGTRVFSLKYVSADEMADLLTGILSGSAGGAPGPYEQRLLPQRVPAGRAAPAPRPPTAAAATAAGGVQFFSDPRTNSLIVVTGPERLEVIAKWIAEFDRPVDYSSTLAFLPLQHARADEVADLLNQAFGGAAAAKSTSTTAPRTPRREGVGSTSATGGAYQSRSAFPESGLASEEGRTTVLAVAPDAEGASAVLTQAGEAPQQGRTGEGRVVPLIEARDVTVIADLTTNSLIVNASPEKLELVKALVKQRDVVPTQVLIQGIIAEVNLSKRTQLGLEFSLTSNNIFRTGAEGTVKQNFGLEQEDSEGIPIPLTGLSWTVTKTDFSGLLNALASDSNVNILSTPKIFTTSGKKATIDVSTQVPFAKGQFTSSIGGGISTSFDYQSVGIVLEVTPIVSQDGTVTMEVSQTADDLIRFEELAADLKLPVISKRLAEATVWAQDGDTVVLGGLMADRTTKTVSGVPLLKDLPLIGWAFRSTDSRKEKTELLVFLTPQVVRAPEESRLLTEQQREQLKGLPKIPVSPTGPER